MKNKFSLREKIFFSPWAMLSVFILGIALLNVVAFAEEDKIVGHTHDGLPVYESDIPKDDVDKLTVDRELTITLKKIAIKEKYLNGNSIEISTGGNNYTIVLDCLITENDTFEWVGVDGRLKIGHQVGVRRTPLKNWSNPDFTNSKIKKELLEQAEDFDKFERQCTIQWIQKIKVIEVLTTPTVTEDVRG